MKEFNCRKAIFSKSLDKLEVLEIGRKLEGSVLKLFFRKGVMTQVFQREGKEESVKDWEKIFSRQGRIRGLKILMIAGGIP